MSSLRARCPDCGTFTAVAVGSGYECHACGADFPAGLVRVPRAWGSGGDAMAEAASLPLRYPDTGSVEMKTLGEQTARLETMLPERPVVVGGCCCAHIGAVRGLAARRDRVAVVWLDAHGDLNTPESSPSGNAWGMPLRMLLDDGIVSASDVALVGARNLDPPEEAFIAASGIDDSIERALDGLDAAYVALDLDVLDLTAVEVFMPEPDGLSVDDVKALLTRVASKVRVAGIGITGHVEDTRNLPVVARLLEAAGF